MKYQKLIVNHLLKEFELINVSKECFNNSPLIECAGLCDALKVVYGKKELRFRTDYLKSIKYKEVLK